MYRLVVRVELFGSFEFAQSVVVPFGIGVEDAEIEVGELVFRIHPDRLFEEGQCGFGVTQFHFSVAEIGEGLNVIGVQVELRLKLLCGFVELQLAPEQITEAEVRFGHFGIALDGSAELIDCRLPVFHFIEGFSGEHVGFGRFGIEGKDLLIDIHDALILLRSKATVRERKAEGQVLWVGGGSFFEEGNGISVLAGAVIGEADQCGEPQGLGRVILLGFQKRGEELGRLFEIAILEEGKAEIQLQAGHGGVERGCLSVERDSVGEVFLARFKQAKVGEGFGVLRMGFQDGLPCRLCLSEVTLLFEAVGRLSLVVGGRRRLGLRRE